MSEIARQDQAAADVPSEEEAVLARVRRALDAHEGTARRRSPRYDRELIALRDEIGEARREDVPALIAQMERLQGVGGRSDGQAALVDPRSPYFGHLRLREGDAGGRERDVLIGRATLIDPA